MRISDWSSDVCSSDLQALWCPTTRRVLDVGFRGLSPYDRGRIHPRATPILVPRLAFPNGRAASGRRVDDVEIDRSGERRVGKEWVRTCRSRWSPYPLKKQSSTRTGQK